MVIIDFETYSPVPIDAGSVKYSKHPKADIVLLGYKIDDEPTQIWYPWEGLEAIELIERNGPVYAHNALFDLCIWQYVGVEKYSFPMIPLSGWRDTLALCNRYTLPNKLADVGSILNVSVQKDRRGTALIKKICVPVNGQRPKHGVHYTNQDLQDFADYCRQDVDSTYELLKVLPAKSLSESEQYYWQLTQSMNLRGLPIDTEAIEKILAYIEGYAEEMTQRVPELTNGVVEKATQVKRIIDWLKTRGIKVTNLRADTVDRLLASEVPDDVYEMLELRQILGRSSTAKYNALALMEHNGRIYNNLQYHGANTGRWTGRGFQMHNLPRATVPDPEEQVERFKTFKPVDKPVATAKALIRSMIWAPPRRMLMVSDYSSIEYHLLCWVSGDDDAVEAAFNHVDAYIDMAAHLYGKAHSAVSKGERQMGKVIILGCIAAGTLVLTDKGAVPIEQIKPDHKLWDGYEWVSHDGVLDKGAKDCVLFNRIALTPDHEVYLTDTKEEVWPHVDNIQSERQAISLVIGKLLNTFPELSRLKRMPDIMYVADSVESNIFTFWQTLKKARQLSVEPVDAVPNLNLIWTHIAALQDLIKKLSIDLSTDGTQLKPDVLCQRLLSSKTTEAAVLQCVPNGATTLGLLLNMLWNYPDTMTPTWNLTELTTKGTMNPVILSSVPDQKTCLTHDILNAGKRNRFTILTPNGPMLVSNCGYGMGAEKFQEVCASWGIIITLPEAQMAVEAYRAKYYKVKKLWYTLKDCAVAAVRHKGKTFSYQNCHFKCVKDHTGREWLKLLLPSGRALFYMEPYVEPAKYGWSIGHMGMNSHSKKWSRLWLSPGRITENVIQGLGSDVMRVGLKQVEMNMPEVRLIGTVHDEAIGIVLEEDSFQDTLETFNKHLCTTEDWNNGMYLHAEGYFSKRYKKG